MRSTNSVMNTIVAIIMNILNILITFCAQTVFISQLGVEYNGINGLFLNIVSMLSIVELGIGSAIVYNLYKPIKNNDKEAIKSLMKFYKKSYHLIAVIVFLIGVCIIPFLNTIVGQVRVEESIHIIFLLFLIDTTFSYLLSYKRSILYASEKTYIVNIVHILYLVVMNAAQIALLIKTNNYIIYLTVKIVCRILENIIITIIANKRYPYINEKDSKELEKSVKDNINIKVRGLLFHKISSFIILGTDNIIISKFLGVYTVGLYTNYSMIINALTQILSQIYAAITASIGNLLVENNKEKSYQIFKKLNFFNYISSSFCAINLCVLANTFVNIWLGKEYILPYYVIIILAINFYMQTMRKTINAFKEAAGVFYEDRFVPIIESIVNIVASIILVKLLGISGVFIGTIISTLVIYVYSYPKYVYIPLFGKKRIEFLKENLYYFIILIFNGLICIITLNYINIGNLYLDLICKLVVSVFLITLINIIIFHKKEEYKYFINLARNVFINIVNKVKKLIILK